MPAVYNLLLPDSEVQPGQTHYSPCSCGTLLCTRPQVDVSIVLLFPEQRCCEYHQTSGRRAWDRPLFWPNTFHLQTALYFHRSYTLLETEVRDRNTMWHIP